MIGYLKGQIIDHQDGRLLIALGVASGTIGYSVTVPASAVYGALLPGKIIELFIHTHVREDALDLYGFTTSAEKELFLTLLTVNGIGPKGALGILSKVEPSTLIQAVLTGDKVTLTQIPGIGKKTAERVVLELADPLKKKVAAGMFVALGNGPLATNAPGGPASGASSHDVNAAILKDAKDALVGLGYREQDVAVLLKKVLEDKKPPSRVEDLIRTALQRLN